MIRRPHVQAVSDAGSDQYQDKINSRWLSIYQGGSDCDFPEFRSIL